MDERYLMRAVASACPDARGDEATRSGQADAKLA
jgi:hypothetical protein